MSDKKKRQITFSYRSDGTIRAYQADTKDKRGVSEINIICPTNAIAPTLTTQHPPLVYYEETDTIQSR